MRFPILSYIDPGAGSLLLQFILAFVVGVFVFFRSAVRKLFSFLIGRGTETDLSPSHDKKDRDEGN